MRDEAQNLSGGLFLLSCDHDGTCTVRVGMAQSSKILWHETDLDSLLGSSLLIRESAEATQRAMNSNCSKC